MGIKDLIYHINKESYNGNLKVVNKIKSVNCKEWDAERRFFEQELWLKSSSMATRYYVKIKNEGKELKKHYHDGHIDVRPISASISDAFLPIPKEDPFYFVTCKKSYKSDDHFNPTIVTVPYTKPDKNLSLCSPSSMWILLTTLSQEFGKEYLSLIDIINSLPEHSRGQPIALKEYAQLLKQINLSQHLYLGKKKKELYDACEKKINEKECKECILSHFYWAFRNLEEDFEEPFMDWRVLYSYIESEIPVYLVFKYDDLKKEINYKEESLFSWNSIPGNDNNRFLRFLNKELYINRVKNVNITKTDDDRIIHIFTKEESIEIMLVENNKKATLKISDGRTYNLQVKEENGKLNIYRDSSDDYHTVIAIGHTLDDKGNVSNFIIHDVTHAPFVEISKKMINKYLQEALVVLPKNVLGFEEIPQNILGKIIKVYNENIHKIFKKGTKIRLRPFLMRSQRVKFWYTNKKLYPSAIRRMYSHADFPNYVWIFEIGTQELKEKNRCIGQIIIDATESEEDNIGFVLINFPKIRLWYENKKLKEESVEIPTYEYLPLFRNPYTGHQQTF